MRQMIGVFLAMALLVGVTSLTATNADADGTETLGPPSVAIASGTGTVAAGTGLEDGPSTIELDVPLGVSIEQVLVYWEGQSSSATVGLDPDIQLDGNLVFGTLIGGPTLFFGTSNWSSTYRADITGLGLVSPGLNTINVSDLNFDRVSNGAGILVIINDGGPLAELTVVDGNDLAFINFAPPLDSTVPQTVTFAPAPVARVATIDLFASSVAPEDGIGSRPNIVLVTVDGVTTEYGNLLGSLDGREWDTLHLDIDIPAGATTLTVELVSDDPADPDTGNLPASMAFSAAAFSIPAPPDPGIDIEKLTNGNQADGANDADVPQIAPGDTVTWTYIVTNTGDVPFDIADVDVSDDIIGAVTTIVDQGDGDNVLAPGEVWTYEATAANGAEDLQNPSAGTVVVNGCNPSGDPVPGDRATYENIGTVTVPGDDDSDPSHYCNPPVVDIDIEKYTKVVVTSTGGDLCDADGFGKPKQVIMQYTGEGADATNTSQQDGKHAESGDPNGASPVYIIASRDAGGSGTVYFSGTVSLDETFVIDAGTDKFGSGTHVTIFASQGGPVLQNIMFHTSCSAPLVLGDQFASLILVGLVGTEGLAADLPDPDPSDIGEDADTPTGPEATAGDTIQWTYLVTNPGDVPLTNVVVDDDNGTSGDPSDDFSPAPLLDAGFNVGDTNQDGNLDPGEQWVYRATGTAILGQYANLSDVVGTPVGGGDDVTDADPSHYFGVFGQDICEAFRKPVQLTLRYTGDGPDATSHNQDPGKVIVSGDPNDASPVIIEFDGSEIGVVNLGDTFTISGFGSSTKITIRSLGGQVLQTSEFHTSCSQPLFIGDQFGAIELVDSRDENFQGPSDPDFTGLFVKKVEYKDDEVKVRIKNTGPTDVAITQIEISFPASNGLLKKITVDAKYDPNPDLGSPALILASQFDDPSKVRVKAGDERELKFEFTDKNPDPGAGDYTITVKFADGTELIIP